VTVAAIDTGLALSSGTSFSTPLIAASPARAVGPRPRPAVELPPAASHGLRPVPRAYDTIGYGIPDALKLYAFPTASSSPARRRGRSPAVTPTLSWDAGTSPPGHDAQHVRLRVWDDSAAVAPVLDTTIA